MYNTCMPYNYAHALVGLYAADHCANPEAMGITDHYGAFFLGTMGPDPYYGDAFLPPVGSRARTDLADRLHALDGERLFSTLFTLSNGNAARTAYTFGLLCHFLLDNRAHPYIEARFPGRAHTPAEIAMDLPAVAYFSERRLTVSPRAFYDCADVAEIDALHTALFWKLFSLRTQGVYARSLKKWLRLNTVSFDPSGRKRRLLRPFGSLASYFVSLDMSGAHDALNLDCAPWKSMRGVSTDSFPALLIAAREEAVTLIDLVCAGETDEALMQLKERSADAAENLSE